MFYFAFLFSCAPTIGSFQKDISPQNKGIFPTEKNYCLVTSNLIQMNSFKDGIAVQTLTSTPSFYTFDFNTENGASRFITSLKNCQGIDRIENFSQNIEQWKKLSKKERESFVLNVSESLNDQVTNMREGKKAVQKTYEACISYVPQKSDVYQQIKTCSVLRKTLSSIKENTHYSSFFETDELDSYRSTLNTKIEQFEHDASVFYFQDEAQKVCSTKSRTEDLAMNQQEIAELEKLLSSLPADQRLESHKEDCERELQELSTHYSTVLDSFCSNTMNELSELQEKLNHCVENPQHLLSIKRNAKNLIKSQETTTARAEMFFHVVGLLGSDFGWENTNVIHPKFSSIIKTISDRQSTKIAIEILDVSTNLDMFPDNDFYREFTHVNSRMLINIYKYEIKSNGIVMGNTEYFNNIKKILDLQQEILQEGDNPEEYYNEDLAWYNREHKKHQKEIKRLFTSGKVRSQDLALMCYDLLSSMLKENDDSSIFSLDVKLILLTTLPGMYMYGSMNGGYRYYNETLNLNTLNERFMESFGIEVFEIMESCTDFTVEFFKQIKRRGQYRENRQSSSSVSCYIDCYCAAYDTTERFENKSSCPSLGNCPDASSAQGDKIKVYNVSMASHWKKVGGTCR